MSTSPLLDAYTQPKFIETLPNPLDPDFIFRERRDSYYRISIKPFVADLGLVHPVDKTPLSTPMWGYSGRGQPPTYPGRTFVARKNHPIDVQWKNKLLDEEGKPVTSLVPIDTTIHWADPLAPPYPKSGIPLVTHLHGGHTEAASDGYPEAWFTPNFSQVGVQWKKKTYTYSNDQEAATLWYHDHTLGITRTNVYAGLAGFYILRDCHEESLDLPEFPYEVPIVIQDKDFTEDGALFYPSEPLTPESPTPSVHPEFFGNFIVVNGKIWPKLKVEPRVYRLRLLNGSDSRFYHLRFMTTSGPITFYQIGSDQGLFYEPVPLKDLLIAPGQRADLLVDFCKFKGERITVTNDAPTPFPDGDLPDPETTGLIMAFDVSLPLKGKSSKIPKRLRRHPIRALESCQIRQVLLFESTDEYGRILPLLGTPELGGLMWHQSATEQIRLGTTEIWEIYNTTMDAHPIHLHAGRFQLVDRQEFNAEQNPDSGALTDINLVGPIIKPPPEEKGWIDTVIVPPSSSENTGQITRIIMQFNIAGTFVWHCHILSHEDHDMMRPMIIIPN